MNKTLMNIIDELRFFCENHYNNPRFEFEAVENLQNFATEDKDYPIVFASYVSHNPVGSMMNYRIRIHVLNRINRDRENTLDNYTDTSLILSDICKLWDEDSDSEIMLMNEPFSDVYNNSQLDYCQGVYADFDLESPDYSRCAVPSSQFTPSPPPPPVCKDANYIVEYEDGTLIEEGTIVSGGNKIIKVDNCPIADTVQLDINGVEAGDFNEGTIINLQLNDGTNTIEPSNVIVNNNDVTVSVDMSPKWWVRNPDWVSLPEINAGDNTFACVAAVYEDNNLNWFRISGFTSIDWGDGTTSGAEHQFIYNDTTSPICVDNNGRNYKTILVTGGSATHLSFHNGLSNEVRSQNWLDLKIDSPNQQVLGISTYNEGICPLIERVEFISPMPDLFFSNSRMSYMTNLKVLKGFDFSSITTGGATFQQSGDFRADEDGTPINFNISNSANSTQEFYISSLTIIGDVTVTSATNIASMFTFSKLNCPIKIISSPLLENISLLINATTATGLEITDCSGITNPSSFAPFRSLEFCLLHGITVGFNVAFQKMSADALNDMFTALGNANGSQTIIITGNIGTATCDTTIATNKGWTITA